MPTFYATDALLGSYQEMTEVVPGANATSSPQTGWVVGTLAATNRSSFDSGTNRANNTFAAATTQPDGTLDNTLGDALRSTNLYSGIFAAGTWTFTFSAIGVTQAGAADGNIVFRLFRGSLADGSNAVELTAGQQSGGVITNLSTTQADSALTTASIGSFNAAQEYIFCQMAWNATGAGGMTTTDVAMRVGSTATRLVSPAFSPSSLIISQRDLVQRLLRRR